jgi:hypothetical protein
MAVEFAQDVADVAFGGERADDEPAGDLRVAQAAGHEHEHVAFAVGEPGDLRYGCVGVASCRELGDETTRDTRREERVPAIDDLDGMQP